MIRHRPAGLGHPYRDEPDQRIPVCPVEGDPIELRATTPRGLNDLVVELELGPHRERLPMERFDPAATPPKTSDGHLDAAAAARMVGRNRQAWRACLPAQDADARLRYRFLAAGDWETPWFEVTVAGWSAEAAGRGVVVGSSAGPAGAGRLIEDSVRWLRADKGPLRVRFGLRLEAGAHVMGFGERFDRLDQSGQRLDAVVFEQYKNQGNRTYMPVPFAIVVPSGQAGWGFHVRTSRRVWFDVGASDPDVLWIEVALDADEAEPSVEVALYDGQPAGVLRAFLDEVGQPALPPDWIFRPWMSGNEWNTEAIVRAQVERTLAERIPAGVVVVEAWSDESTFAAFRDARYEVHPDGAPHRLADFTFPPDGAWPDPKGLVDWLHERGVRLILWQVPLMRVRPAPTGQARADRDTMVERRYGIREADGRPYRNRGWWFPGALMPDWTNPEAKDWWLAKRRYLVEELGIDGFKTDGGEHAWGDELRYADGTRGAETNNRYPVLYATAYHELMRDAGRDPVTFSRAGHTGAGSVPCHWAGDENSTWEAFRASITAGLSAGASGLFFWGWDIGGFSGEIPSAELYLRAAAMATFCPIMQYHSEFHFHRRPSRNRTPWNIGERTSDARVIPAYRRFAELRERLVPYLAEQARASVDRRIPLMRALAFEWPNDPAVWDFPFEYMLGDDLLVAPVVEPDADRWEVYLPEGEWIDLWRGVRCEGPTLLAVAAPLDEIPVFVRASASDGLRDLVGGTDPD